MFHQTHIKSFSTIGTLLYFLLSLCPQDDSNRGQDSHANWVFNYPSTPLKIAAIGDRAFKLVNLGRSRILAYQLGCVTNRDSHPLIVAIADRKSADIGVSDKEETIAMHVLTLRQKCLQENAMLSVVWVRFDDEAEWVAGRLPIASTK